MQVVVSDESEGKGRVNIDGKDVEVQRVGKLDTSRDKLGNRFTERWTGDGLSLEIDYQVTFTCDGYHGDGDCEIVSYRATIHAKGGDRRQTVKVKGDCGC